MPEHLRALVYLLAIAVVVWGLAGQQRFGLPIAADDFARRRNLWFAVTLFAFLSFNFWLFIGLSAIAVAMVGRRDPNPIALYLVLLLALPPFFAEIPGAFGIDHLFAVDMPRMLALVLLLPAWLVLRARPDVDRFGTLWPDRFLAGYLVLYFVAQIPFDSLTNSIRVALFYPFIEIFLPYYVASRTVRSVKAFKDVAATLAVVGMVLALIAAFEFVRSWLLYAALNDSMGIRWYMSSYLTRGEGGRLRAQASVGHALAFGYVMVIALLMFMLLRPQMSAPQPVQDAPTNRAHNTFGGRYGISLVGALMAIPLALLSFLRPSSYVPGRPATHSQRLSRSPALAWRLGAAALVLGLICSLSRGPWVGAAAGLLVLASTGPQVFTRLLKLGVGLTIGLGLLMSTEYGARIIQFLPFIGTVENFNVTYRQRLFDVSLDVIAQRPLFGAFDFMSNPLLEQMRQGEGIIDIVNTYLGVAMRNGLVGLALFLGVFVSAMWGIVQCLRRLTDRHSDEYLLGRVLLATLVGVMVTIATVSSILTIGHLYFTLLGLCVGYRQMLWARLPAPQVVPRFGHARRL